MKMTLNFPFRFLILFSLISLTIPWSQGWSQDSEGSPPRIVVIGAGMAGMVAAYRLEQMTGFPVEVYEASAEVGGRVQSQDLLLTGAGTDLGATFIDSNHHYLHQLAHELGLPMIRLKVKENPPPGILQLNGKSYTSQEIFHLFLPQIRRIAHDQKTIALARMTEGTRQGKLSSVEKRLNHLSMAQYLQEISAPELMKTYLRVLFQSEYGSELEELNALHLFELATIDLESQSFEPDGNIGDEEHEVLGGNQKIILGIKNNLKGPIQVKSPVTAIRSEDSRKFTLILQTPEGKKEKEADYVVMTAPLPVLRENIKIEVRNFPDDKKELLAKAEYGNNTKFVLFFNRPFWKLGEKEGDQNLFQMTTEKYLIWDSGFKQSSNGLYNLTAFSGGNAAKENMNLNPEQGAKEVLAALKVQFPDVEKYFVRTAPSIHWPSQPYIMGSYSGKRRPGQWKMEKGLRTPQVGNLFFAGEQWSQDFQGFMNGAAETGEKAAQQIAKLIRGKPCLMALVQEKRHDMIRKEMDKYVTQTKAQAMDQEWNLENFKNCSIEQKEEEEEKFALGATPVLLFAKVARDIEKSRKSRDHYVGNLLDKSPALKNILSHFSGEGEKEAVREYLSLSSTNLKPEELVKELEQCQGQK